MSIRELYFNPTSAEMRFDYDYDLPVDIPKSIKWPNENQRNNMIYGFKNLTLALTMNCNLECDYCWQKHGLEADMQRTTIDKWLEFFLDDNINQPNKILYYGGEPLLRLDLIQYASNRMKSICYSRNIPPVQQHIFTNGTLLTAETVAALKAEKIFLILSIDGNDAANSLHRHSKCDSNLYDTINRGIHKLKEYNVAFGVCCTISNPNFNLDETVGYILDNIGPSSIELNIRHDRDFIKIADKFKEKTLYRFIEAWDLIAQHNVQNIDLKKRLSAILSGIPLQNSSSGSKNKLSVMMNGNVSTFNGAVSFPELQIVPDGDWISSFKKRWERNILSSDKCKKCRAAFICGQGSAFSSFLQYGDFNHVPALHCEYCNTVLTYILDKIKKTMLSRNPNLPLGYIIKADDIIAAFPSLLNRSK